MRTALLLFALLPAIGCTSSSPAKIHRPSQHAPVNQPDGEVSYCDAGARSIKEARRNDAYRKMSAACGGAYAIVREESGQVGMGMCANVRKIHFDCVDPS